MHDMTAHAAAHHAPPQGFIRKYVFSVDHKVIGIQYTDLGPGVGVHRDGAFLGHAHPPGLADGEPFLFWVRCLPMALPGAFPRRSTTCR